MKLSWCKMLFGGLILVTLADSSLSQNCCSFDNYYPCDWNWVPTSWHQAPPNYPDITDPSYYNFQANDGAYTWLQDQSGTMSSTHTFDVSSSSTVFSFNYYYNSLSPLSDEYLHVVFQPKGSLNGIVIASITEAFDEWIHREVTCDSSVNFCCGSYADIPCTGTIEIVGSLDVTNNKGLFGFDGICSDGHITTATPITPTNTPNTATNTPITVTVTDTPIASTSTPVATTNTPYPYTLPPPRPSPTGCCKFDTDACDFYVMVPYWYWSQSQPNPAVPTSYDGTRTFLWAQTSGAQIGNALTPYVDYTTFFSLSYYISSPSVNLNIYFAQTGFSPRYINTLYMTGPVWNTFAIQAASLCVGGSSCTGSFEIEVGGNGLVAIDNADINGACGGYLPCCNFDDPYICHLIPNNPTYPWKWSGNSVPLYPYVYPPTPNSQYIYFETQNYIGPNFESTLSSAPITISSSTTFRGNFFVYTPAGESGMDSLQLNFRESITGITTGMQFAKTTSNTWFVAEFACFSLHGDCCQGQSICQGILEINAFVEQDGGTVFYGIDAFDINDVCPTFPSLMMTAGSESKIIPLKPKQML